VQGGGHGTRVGGPRWQIGAVGSMSVKSVTPYSRLHAQAGCESIFLR
jgi:hypothetical protein